MHATYRMIRKHCGIRMYFQHLHRFLDQKLIKAGAPDGVRTNATDLQSRAALGDIPVIGRWEYMQTCRLNYIVALRQFVSMELLSETFGKKKLEVRKMRFSTIESSECAFL